MADNNQKNGKAAAIPLTVEDKLRVVFLLFMHQKTPIKYDGFDPGTGHSSRAIQGLMDRLKKQFITDAKPGDAVTPAANAGATATAASVGNAVTKKKRGRSAKSQDTTNEDNEDTSKPAVKKSRKTVVKKEPVGETMTRMIDSARNSRENSKTPAHGTEDNEA